MTLYVIYQLIMFKYCFSLFCVEWLKKLRKMVLVTPHENKRQTIVRRLFHFGAVHAASPRPENPLSPFFFHII